MSEQRRSQEECVKDTKRVMDLVAGGQQKIGAALKVVGLGQPQFYAYRKRILAGEFADLIGNGHAHKGNGRALMTTVDGRGNKLIPAGFLLDAMKELRLSTEQLERLIGIEIGSIDKYIRTGQAPNTLALAINGLMAERNLSRTGTGGYIPKKGQKFVLIQLPKEHIEMLGVFVRHHGGAVCYTQGE